MISLLKRLSKAIKACLNASLYILNLLLCSLLLYIVAVIKVVYRTKKGRQMFERIGYNVAKFYAFINDKIISLTSNIIWEIDDTSHLSKNEWYLLLSNHQNWMDIVILEKVFVRKIPMLKFFVKKELLWVPLVGTSCWVLNFPFMKRYSKAFLDKNPHLRGQDLETTRKACAMFQMIPTTLINFAEGTRVSPEKQKKTHSPFKHLLKPKAGGAAFSIAAMNGMLKTLIDVTIIYHTDNATAWNFLCGNIPKVTVTFKVKPITSDLMGDYQNDEHFRAHFQDWLNTLWAEKDNLIEQRRIDK
ncbi:MAG: acyltransferase [Gammaproteobacteria bacterium]|nr:acyltransferase [Gammaproteobacteria bacterium]